MSPEQASRLIESVGGDSAFGRLLNIDQKEGWQQRINNWKRRGMPANVVLEHYDQIKALQNDDAFVADERIEAPAEPATQ